MLTNHEPRSYGVPLCARRRGKIELHRSQPVTTLGQRPCRDQDPRYGHGRVIGSGHVFDEHLNLVRADIDWTRQYERASQFQDSNVASSVQPMVLPSSVPSQQLPSPVQ